MNNSQQLNEVDQNIYDCLNPADPKSFFLFAGAGSGKTRSLVNVLTKIKYDVGRKLKMNRQRIAVITYTNAACNEIMHRLDQDSLFFVSTIHSFVWELIKPYQNDIREWLRKDILANITETEAAQAKGRANTKASVDRANKLISMQKRLDALPSIKAFNYSPTGDNRTRDSLNHSEVIYIAADFLTSKPLMQKILVKKFPVLLIDESQDTKKELIDAFFLVQSQHKAKFSLGLFGDTMQRIYSDGKQGLGDNLPEDWVTPAKTVNHRCPKRVVRLINKIRMNADEKQQTPVDAKEEGVARLYIVGQSDKKKGEIEAEIAVKMAQMATDPLWTGPVEEIKVLTLEHKMAANRMNFLPLFEPLYDNDRIKTGLIDGSLAELRLLTEQVLPLIEAKRAGDSFEVARIVKKFSPLLDRDILKAEIDQRVQLKLANDAVNSLYSLWQTGEPTLFAIIKNLHISKLFNMTDTLAIIAKREDGNFVEDPNDTQDEHIASWDKALQATFEQISPYKTYVSGKGKFGTHQGVKGLQFERVMVILDDEEAGGFLFSYGKIFGDTALTKTDQDNTKAGKENSVDRTMRLFYVACSRAEKSLAVVVYSQNPQQVKQHVMAQNWFTEDEIEIVN